LNDAVPRNITCDNGDVACLNLTLAHTAARKLKATRAMILTVVLRGSLGSDWLSGFPEGKKTIIGVGVVFSINSEKE
jgi:hypothetical protein